jgi:hypothetical protein
VVPQLNVKIIPVDKEIKAWDQLSSLLKVIAFKMCKFFCSLITYLTSQSKLDACVYF